MWSRMTCLLAVVLANAVCVMSFAGTTYDAVRQSVAAWVDGMEEGVYRATLRASDGVSPLSPKRINDRLFAFHEGNLRIGIGFSAAPERHSTLKELQSTFSHIALDRVPVPGLAAKNWEIRLQTPRSSFKKGVTLESWETGVLRIRVQTEFFAASGRRTDIRVPADAGMPEGTYFQIRRPIKTNLVIECRLFDKPADPAGEPGGGS